MFALMQSVVLLWLIPVDLLIVWWVFRFALSLADIVENVLYAPQHDYDVTVESKTTMPLLLPFAERLGRMQEAVSEAVAEAVKGERLKTELLTNVSHDLKTPLTAVINYVKLLMQYPLEDENVKAYVAILDEKTQRLKTLVDDILEMSKLTSGNVRLSIETVDLEQVLTQALAEFENNLSQRGLMLMRRENEVPIYVEADSDKLWRVMENLLGNIAKYAQEGSRVYVVTTLQKHFVQLELKNISAEPLSQEGVYFTERFARGDQARGSEGSGLGLAIAKELVERMAGHFDVSVDGDLFKVTLVFERRTERSGGIGVQ
jgi:signal transduction histidine kinase